MFRAVFFDVGGVLIINRDRASKQSWASRLEIGVHELEDFVFHGSLAQEALMGRLSNREQWKRLGERFRLNSLDVAQMKRDFLTKGEENKRLITYISRLRQANFKTGILSNDNTEARHLWTTRYSFVPCFDKVIVSAEEGIVKPNLRIYRQAARSLRVPTNEAIMVDNSAENIDAAEAVGMLGIHFKSTSATLRQLKQVTGIS